VACAPHRAPCMVSIASRWLDQRRGRLPARLRHCRRQFHQGRDEPRHPRGTAAMHISIRPRKPGSCSSRKWARRYRREFLELVRKAQSLSR
jgi:hypothetical protein